MARNPASLKIAVAWFACWPSPLPRKRGRGASAPPRPTSSGTGSSDFVQSRRFIRCSCPTQQPSGRKSFRRNYRARASLAVAVGPPSGVYWACSAAATARERQEDRSRERVRSAGGRCRACDEPAGGASPGERMASLAYQLGRAEEARPRTVAVGPGKSARPEGRRGGNSPSPRFAQSPPVIPVADQPSRKRPRSRRERRASRPARRKRATWSCSLSGGGEDDCCWQGAGGKQGEPLPDRWQASRCPLYLTMEKWVFCLLVTSTMAMRALMCPMRCSCQTVSPSFTILCTKNGLLFVPPAIDRRTAELRLMDNFITSLRRKDFANMTDLIHLTLSRNTISHIMPYAFFDLKGLHALHLDSNRLTYIDEDHFKGLINLRHLILSNNQLHYISSGSFDDFIDIIEDLDLSYNNLVNVPWETVGRLSNANTISLDHNLIDFVPEGIFSDLHKLARLDMTSNQLRKIPPDPLFSRIPVYAKPKGTPLSSLVLSFGGNPLHCNCELVWLRRLTREDDLETCASPPELMGKYFWSIKEEEFVCEPPMITRRTAKQVIMEGQSVSLKCRAVGDPEPYVRWISPGGKLVSNTSRTISYENGTLDILETSMEEHGMYTCIASNAAGESTAPVELLVNPYPHLANSTNSGKEAETGPSDILISAKSNFSNETKSRQERKVAIAELTSSSALIQWPSQHHISGMRMFQIQYNSSADDILVYRMIPPSSKSFFLTDLVAGRDYDLCVLAVYDDGVTSLTATLMVGCVQFSTEEAYQQCQSLHAQFLGGTMIIIIGGIIVASVLVFIFILLLKYKVYINHHKTKNPEVNNVCSQTNGSQSNSMVHSSSKLAEWIQQERSSSPFRGKTIVDFDYERAASTEVSVLRNEVFP